MLPHAYVTGTVPKGRVVVGGKRWRGSRCQRSGAFAAHCCKLQLGYCMRFLFLWACGVCVCGLVQQRVQMFPCVCLHVLYIAVGQSCFECMRWPACSMHVATSNTLSDFVGTDRGQKRAPAFVCQAASSRCLEDATVQFISKQRRQIIQN